MWVESMIEMANIFAAVEPKRVDLNYSCSLSLELGESAKKIEDIIDTTAESNPMDPSINTEIADINCSALCGITKDNEDDIDLTGRNSVSPSYDILNFEEINRLREGGMAKWRLNRYIVFLAMSFLYVHVI